MPGQTPRLSAIRRHDVGVDIAVILTGEGDPFPIRRKIWPPFMAARCELARFAAASRNSPQIAAVGKDDARLIHRGPSRKQRRFLRGRDTSSGDYEQTEAEYKP